MEEIVLLRPTAEYAVQIIECKIEYIAADSSMDGCGPMRRTDDPIEYIEKCAIEEAPETCPAPLVPATQFMLVRKADNKVVCFLQIGTSFAIIYPNLVVISAILLDRAKDAKDMQKKAIDSLIRQRQTISCWCPHSAAPWKQQTLNLKRHGYLPCRKATTLLTI